jgi:hypothetical protein
MEDLPVMRKWNLSASEFQMFFLTAESRPGAGPLLAAGSFNYAKDKTIRKKMPEENLAKTSVSKDLRGFKNL